MTKFVLEMKRKKVETNRKMYSFYIDGEALMFCNFAVCNITSEEVTLKRILYSQAELEALRANRSEELYIFRDGNYIYTSAKTNGTENTIGTEFRFNWNNRPYLTKKLAHQMILHILRLKAKNSNFTIDSYGPIRFYSNEDKENVISGVLPDGAKIRFAKGYSIDTRVIYNDKNPVIGVLVNPEYRWINQYTCEDLMGIIPLVGYRVYEYKQLKQHLPPMSKFTGTIVSIEGKIAILEKDGENIQRNLSELHVNCNLGNLQSIVSGLNGHTTWQRVRECFFNSKRKNAREIANNNNNFYSWLEKCRFESNAGFSFQIGKLFDDSSLEWRQSFIQKPTFVFDYHGVQTDISSDSGLRKYGPYDKIHFEYKTPRIAVICQAQHRGTVTNFLDKLTSGIQLVKNDVFTGMQSKYHLTNIRYDIFTAEKPTINAYEKAIRECLGSNCQYHLAIVETCDEFKLYRTNENPYFLSKIKFMNRGIPVQEVRIETMHKSDAGLIYVLNNIALAIYAKLKGEPWIIPRNQKIDHELIIGIGSSFVARERNQKRRRVVGVTTIFSGDGRYLLNNKSKDVNIDEYFEELLSSVRNSIEEIKRRQNWQEQETVRLVIHAFKPLRDIEAEVIKKLADDYKEEIKLDFAFLHISQDHPFRIFDPTQQGIRGKGIYTPSRGTNLCIDGNNQLLQLVGPRELKTDKQGMGVPLLIKLHRYSTFTDLGYLTQQIYTFSYLSWRSFFPSSMPITILYPQLIARLLGNMRNVPSCDPDAVVSGLRGHLWFL
ncbi:MULTISPECIES: Piwi domain-containing protein [Sporomusa]|uniref:argonaute/piwi family protein n=1 Tax=Sporomusa TaxID=2375 RepID=UPI00166A3277|nr:MULTISPECIES: Piwi domain-containing protein [Sporomusa]MCM0759085.1 hypothetical protein [Sporomusa sphaeroides DSM 2875]